MMDMHTMLRFAIEAGASDLHLSALAPVMLRKDGEMRRLSFPDRAEPVVLLPDQTRPLIYGLLTDEQKRRLEADKELDLAIQIGQDARFRANIFLQDRGICAVFRVIPTRVPTFAKLGLPESIHHFTELDKGLVLVTGPTGSGKSTTLAAMLDEINRTRRVHILTIEDPIEFRHAPQLAMVNQREVGPHTHRFANALRSALREDPDVILVGELRDLETISLAITAAETGHLVFATLHTNSAAKTVDRIINVFPAGEQAQIRSMFADSFAGVVSQLLLPRVGGGRVGAYEILTATPGVRALIRDGKTHQLLSAIQIGQKHGMQSMELALVKLGMEGKVDPRVTNRLLAQLGAAGEGDPGSHSVGAHVGAHAAMPTGSMPTLYAQHSAQHSAHGLPARGAAPEARGAPDPRGEVDRHSDSQILRARRRPTE